MVSPIKDDALGADGVDGTDDRAEITGIAHAVERHPDVAIPSGRTVLQRQPISARTRRRQLCGLSRRVMAVRHFLATLPARCRRKRRCGRRSSQPQGCRAPEFAKDQRPDRPAEVERVDDELQPLGHESVLLIAEFLQRQRLDVLDQRVGKAGDLLDLARRAAGGVARSCTRPNARTARSDSARPADFSADDQLAGLDRPAHAGEGIAHQRVDGEERRRGLNRPSTPRRSGLGVRIVPAKIGQRRQVLEELPQLALRATAIGGRVEQDDVVETAAARSRARRISSRPRRSSGSACRVSPAISWFSRAQPIAFFEASTWVTSAPARAATSEAQARYSRRGSAPSTGRLRSSISPAMWSQCEACSGNTPTWRKGGEAAEIVRCRHASSARSRRAAFSETASGPCHFLVGVAGEDRVGASSTRAPGKARSPRSPAPPGRTMR